VIGSLTIEAVMAILGGLAALLAFLHTRARFDFRVEALERRVEELETRVDAEIRTLSDRMLEVVMRLENLAGRLEGLHPKG
jgi:hypothetical protein